MEKYSIYQDIAERTDGDIYVGVVGPVRTGKSTFIKRFMDLLVLPNIENNYKKERAKDELPQSASGRTIMTTEPKFVPNEAIDVTVADNISFKVRMVDCVGYLVNGAIGHMEGEFPRMIQTPWYDHQIPFEEAAEIGTRKVITEHSTIGLVVTTDGSFGDISRNDYIQAEERVIKELKEINKPFIILLNCMNPNNPDAKELKEELERKYQTPVIAVSCMNLDLNDINVILEKVLLEFPVTEIGIKLPRWVESLDNSHWLKQNVIGSVREAFKDIRCLRSIKNATENLSKTENVSKAQIVKFDLGHGNSEIELDFDEGLFYRVLSELSGMEIAEPSQLVSLITDLAQTKREYDKISYALYEVKHKGYGIVSPSLDELTLEEPEIVKQGGKFGVRLRASAPSIHMIRADIETEVSPIVGTEKQSEELVNYLLREFENDTKKIWESNIFGKSLHELVNEGLHNKLARMPEDAQMKLQETLQKIINEGSGGLICIIL